ncbi:unnamed protein product [Orchesella dallaii]|uniref:C2H2-type domain-containing protein n=1 Tax=Orchesella dallaii TaxID=48710 RepID=A0ABP1RQP7_9HEXA
MPPSKEDFLERKIICMEKRLTHIERFVESRFSEFLQTYATPTQPYPPPPPLPPRPTTTPKSSFTQTPKRAPDPHCRPAPASVKRKAEQVGELPPNPSNDADCRLELEGNKKCVVRLLRLENPGEKKFRPSESPAALTSTSTEVEEASTSIASRTRRIRTPVVKEDFINYTATRARRKEERVEVADDGGDDKEAKEKVKTPKRVSFANEDEDEDQSHEQDDCNFENDMEDGSGCDSEPPSPLAVQDVLEVHYDEDDDGRHQNITENQEEEDYFTYPRTLRPVKTEWRVSRGSFNTKNMGGGDGDSEDEEEVEIGDPSDKDWSGAEDKDIDDEDYDVKVKNSHKRKSDSTGPKRAPPRKRLPDGTLPKRKYHHIKFESLRKGAITLKDPTKMACPVCHKHFKLDMINLHIETHTKVRHLRCNHPNCDKSFYNLNTLNTHKTIHLREQGKGHNCRLCDKLFARSDKCLDHERGCATRAAQRGEVIDPEIISDLERRTKGNWRWVEPTPIKTNELGEEEKILCPYCKFRYKASSFEKHLKKHKSGAKWVCTECDKSYLEKSGLIKHVWTVHQNKKEVEPVEAGVADDGNRGDAEKVVEQENEEVNVRIVILKDGDADKANTETAAAVKDER